MGKAGHDAHVADKRLADYRSDAAVREFFARHQAALAEVLPGNIAAEIKVRQALAALHKQSGEDRLGEYLVQSTLDGTRPPRWPGRPRKAAR